METATALEPTTTGDTMPDVVSIDEARQHAQRVARETVCLEVTLGTLGTRRKVSSNAVETDADRTMVHVGKDIIDSPQLAEIKKLDAGIRQQLRRWAVPASMLKGGHYLLPVGLVETADAWLRDEYAKRTALVADFCDAYPALAEAAADRLGSLYNPADYPAVDDVRQAFKQRTSMMAFVVPDRLRTLNPDLFRRERERFEATWREAADEIRTGLRAMFADLVTHMADRLTPDPDGKKKVFRDTLVTNLTEFLDTFAARNVTDDQELDRLVGHMRDLTRGVDPELLRGDDTLRDHVGTQCAAIKAQLDSMIETRTRKITLDD